MRSFIVADETAIEQYFPKLKRRLKQFNVCFPNENLRFSYRNQRFLFRKVNNVSYVALS
jgi:hypothetical protein